MAESRTLDFLSGFHGGSFKAFRTLDRGTLRTYELLALITVMMV